MENKSILEKAKENKYKTYRLDIINKITELRERISIIIEKKIISNLKTEQNDLKEVNLAQEYNNLINTIKTSNLNLRYIKLQMQELEEKIEKREIINEIEGIDDLKEKLQKQNQFCSYRDEIELCKKTRLMYTIEGNKQKVDEWIKKQEIIQKKQSLRNKKKSYDTQTNIIIENENININGEYNNNSIYKKHYNIQTKTLIEEIQSPIIDINGNIIGKEENTDIYNLEKNERKYKSIYTLNKENQNYNIETKWKIQGDNYTEKSTINIYDKLKDINEIIEYKINQEKEQYTYIKNGEKQKKSENEIKKYYSSLIPEYQLIEYELPEELYTEIEKESKQSISIEQLRKENIRELLKEKLKSEKYIDVFAKQLKHDKENKILEDECR